MKFQLDRESLHDYNDYFDERNRNTIKRAAGRYGAI